MPKVSVIIPTFNQSRYIAEAIASVLAQTFGDYEIVVVDDGSRDDTRQVVARFPQVRYVYQENRGESGARNTGIRLATGQYLAFLDADDTFLPTKLEQQVPILDNRPHVGLVYSDVYLCDGAGNPRGLFSSRIGSRAKSSGSVFEDLVWGNFLTVDSVLVRREVLHRVGLFDEIIRAFPDWELWLRVAAQYAFFYLDAPLARYRVHTGMVSRDRRKMWQGALTVRRKLIASPSFQSCSPVGQQYCYYQLGLLNCLVGDAVEGRRYLWRAFRQPPTRPEAGVAWGLSLLGRRSLQAVVTWRALRRGWMGAI